MKFFDIPEIKNARELFNKSVCEVSSLDLDFIDSTTKAIEIINVYIEDNPTCPNIKRINNMKISYIRSILKKVTLIDGSLKEIRGILSLFVRDEVQQIIYNDEMSKKYFDDFVDNKWKKSIAYKTLRKRIDI